MPLLLGLHYTFLGTKVRFVFEAARILALMFFSFFVPVTKDRSLEEINGHS
jgi:hypothetical protein